MIFLLQVFSMVADSFNRRKEPAKGKTELVFLLYLFNYDLMSQSTVFFSHVGTEPSLHGNKPVLWGLCGVRTF